MAKQRSFPIIGLRIPASDVKHFPKRSCRMTLAIPPDLKSRFCELADERFMATSTLALRVICEWIGEQVIPGESGLPRTQRKSA